jgi:hypothetical protein
LSGEAQRIAWALIQIQRQWAAAQANGFYPAFVSFGALHMNSINFGGLSAGCAKKDIGPLGIWWSSGYEIQRAKTSESVWTLYRVYSFGGPNMKGIERRSKLSMVTNSP